MGRDTICRKRSHPVVGALPPRAARSPPLRGPGDPVDHVRAQRMAELDPRVPEMPCSVMPSRRITAWDGSLSTAVMDQISASPAPRNATSSAAVAASVANPWCHA